MNYFYASIKPCEIIVPPLGFIYFKFYKNSFDYILSTWVKGSITLTLLSKVIKLKQSLGYILPNNISIAVFAKSSLVFLF